MYTVGVANRNSTLPYNKTGTFPMVQDEVFWDWYTYLLQYIYYMLLIVHTVLIL